MPLSQSHNTTSRRSAEVGAMFAAQQPRLRRTLARLVNTSAENVEDACMFAWMQLLSRDLENADAVFQWLLTVARREAIKLDQRARGADRLDGEFASALQPADPHDHITVREAWLDAAAVIAAAGLTARRLTLVGLRAAGLSYEEMAAATSTSLRTVERQLLRADRKLRTSRRALRG
jgi:RNA polymerase sigma factor (sigma-70 family)